MLREICGDANCDCYLRPPVHPMDGGEARTRRSGWWVWTIALVVLIAAMYGGVARADEPFRAHPRIRLAERAHRIALRLGSAKSHGPGDAHGRRPARGPAATRLRFRGLGYFERARQRQGRPLLDRRFQTARRSRTPQQEPAKSMKSPSATRENRRRDFILSGPIRVIPTSPRRSGRRAKPKTRATTFRSTTIRTTARPPR